MSFSTSLAVQAPPIYVTLQPYTTGSTITITTTSPTAVISQVNVQLIELQANATLTLPDIGETYELRVILRQDGTGGRAVSWIAPTGRSILWNNSPTAHPISTNANQMTLVDFFYVNGISQIFAAVSFNQV